MTHGLECPLNNMDDLASGATALSNGYNYVLIFVYLSTDYCCEALFTNLNVTVDNLHQF